MLDGQMDDKVFDCLFAAVTLAKERQITSLNRLQTVLIDEGFEEETVVSAIKSWADYEARKARLGVH